MLCVSNKIGCADYNPDKGICQFCHWGYFSVKSDKHGDYCMTENYYSIITYLIILFVIVSMITIMYISNQFRGNKPDPIEPIKPNEGSVLSLPCSLDLKRSLEKRSDFQNYRKEHDENFKKQNANEFDNLLQI